MNSPKFFDCMLDTETMGLPPDGALLSIGAVFFDIQTQQLGPTFCRSIHLATSVKHGGKIEPSTVMWWLRQGDEARKAVAYGAEDIELVLKDFATWIAQHCRVEDVRPWANSAAFDLTIVGGAYRRLGLSVPWQWWNERCFRTVRNMNAHVEYDTKEKGEGAHNALTDAIFQARHLFRIAQSRKKVAA